MQVDLAEFANLKSGESEEDQVLPMIFHYLDGKGNSDGLLSLDEWVNGMREMGEEMDDEAFEAEVAKWVLLLTNNQRAIWRGVFAKGNAASLVTAMRAAGATHVLLIHHGNAAPMTSATGDAPTDDIKAADSARPLTNQGTAQCMVAREEWFGRLPVRQVILSSPAKRATETAMYISGRSIPGHEDNNETPLVLCEMLHPSIHGETGAASCEELFAQKGFAPLRSYLDAEIGEQAFGVYAEAACSELTAQFRAHGKGREKATYARCTRTHREASQSALLTSSPNGSLTAQSLRTPHPHRPNLFAPPTLTGTCPSSVKRSSSTPSRTRWHVLRARGTRLSTQSSISIWVRPRESSCLSTVVRPFNTSRGLSERVYAHTCLFTPQEASWQAAERVSERGHSLEGTAYRPL